MTELATLKCEVCNNLTPRVGGDEFERLRADLDPEWVVVEDCLRLRREFKFQTFNAAFTRATSVALLAEDQGHHPDMHLGWGYLIVELTTHAIKGLSRNDFIMAAKIDQQG